MIKKSLLIFIFQFYFFAPAHGAFPPSYIATYDVEKSNILIGQSTVILKNSNEQLHYSQIISLVGIAAWFSDDSVTEESWLKKIGDQYVLSKYQYVHNNGDDEEINGLGNGNSFDNDNGFSDDETNEDVFFEAEWKKTKNNYSGIFSGTVHGVPFSLQSPELTWDTLSFLLSLINDVSKGKKHYSYKILREGKFTQYDFTHNELDSVTINGGSYDAVKLVRDQGNRITKIWLAPNLNYIPILIEKFKDNEIDTRITMTKLDIQDE